MEKTREERQSDGGHSPACFIDFEGVSLGGVVKPAMSPNVPNLWSSTVLHQVQLEDRWSLAGTFVIIYWVWRIPDVERDDRKSITGLCCRAQGEVSLPRFESPLHQASPLSAVWDHIEFHQQISTQKERCRMKLLYSTDSHFALQTNM